MNLNKQIKNLDVLDIGLIKWSMVFFTLTIASIWPILISASWYWYAAAFVLVAIRPMMRFWR